MSPAEEKLSKLDRQKCAIVQVQGEEDSSPIIMMESILTRDWPDYP